MNLSILVESVSLFSRRFVNILSLGKVSSVRLISSLTFKENSSLASKILCRTLPIGSNRHSLTFGRNGSHFRLVDNCLLVSTRGLSENVPAIHLKKRPQRKKRQLTDNGEESHSGFWTAVAFATAEEYDLEKLEEGLRKQSLYSPSFVMNEIEGSDKPESSDVLRATAKYQFDKEPREIYFFREGSVVLWNISDLECTNILNFLREFEENCYPENLVSNECEMMKYTYSDQIKKIQLQDEVIILNPTECAHLEKYTFSNAVALSVKLGVLEASLDRYIDSIRFVTEDLRQGKQIRMSREEVLRKIGQLFALRHMINLSSDLLDTPDFYWDREDLEHLYHKMCAYFSIAKRTRVMNEKLNHCMELVELLSSHLNDRHHIRLEWMIIILIMVEVLFEIMHYAERILG